MGSSSWSMLIASECIYSSWVLFLLRLSSPGAWGIGYCCQLRTYSLSLSQDDHVCSDGDDDMVMMLMICWHLFGELYFESHHAASDYEELKPARKSKQKKTD